MTPRESPSPSQSSDLLVAKLASVLPKGYDFGVYHISTPPTQCEALFHAPPGRNADRTYCESHFLAVSIDSSEGEVIIFALEIFIYTTAFASTLFVSKADSSGYLHLLGLPRGTPSPIRSVSSVFVSYLVEQRRRPHIQPVVSLFARAQSQYLFPGSVDNKGKHVLDDRGLVKWWCRVLDGMVGDTHKGYLVVPGLDQYEMRAFLPKGNPAPGRWILGHPLKKISHYVRESERREKKEVIPPRCLIPQYPDDPKARYLDELDDEAERAGQVHKGNGESKANKNNKIKGPSFGNGMWTSVKSLDQFWEMMAYRQECSSGRLTGFIWVVFDSDESEPVDVEHSDLPSDNDGDDDDDKEALRRTKMKARPMAKTAIKTKTKKRSRNLKSKKLRGSIVPRTPRTKTTQQHHYLTKRPATTRYYHWPAEGRGRLLVDPVDYKRINELLLQLDFTTLAKSSISTHRWIKEAGVGSDWRLAVKGEAEYAPAAGGIKEKKDGANDLSSLIKRKRAVSTGEPATEANRANGADGAGGVDKVNVLSTGLVRKKPKPT
ncbi:h3 k56 histone acetylation protein kat11 [Ophiostoma piceae UAMH 11346]|uniref:histone acetyltransferase n=1 Tax=Ophiostoma piceae (strain UAMH 11346) TaxID=1262450 RepID=S3BR23_OPHP1|nr:h3 k56 histone acetylation protein kat11 [Ophiostoma piceae UAMH 11346]